MKSFVLLALLFCFGIMTSVSVGDDYQYKFGEILIGRPSGNEPVRHGLSIEAAARYLDDGAVAWGGERKCVSCHTNGTYLAIRPALSPTLGKPKTEVRDFFVSTFNTLRQEPVEKLHQSTRPAQVIYLANGLAEWDAHVSKSLSPETEAALELMFSIQNENGTWGSLDCWPPFESDAYHEATVAAMAAAAAPGWLAKVEESENAKLKAGVERLKSYLRSEPPKHDYSRVLLLWASARMTGLLEDTKRQEMTVMVRRHQKEDGSWSIRSFAAPEAWGSGNRGEKLRSEPDFADPPGDGHMTGLAIIVLRESGVYAADPQVARGLQWLRTNQRESGRWWTRSLNTDSWHFITYSSTAYALLALQMGNMTSVER
ncbi:MAG: hypothetical protein ACK58L_14795 [Planctomycetota bacterium]